MTNLLDKVAQFKTDADLFHQVIMGDRTAVVTTDGGQVKSLSKWQADRETEVADALNTIQVSLLSILATPPGRYTFTAAAGQTEWNPPAGVTFLPGMPWVFVNGANWNRTESYDDSTGAKITFVRPLTMGYSVTVFIPASVTFPITGVSALDLATAASGKGADMIGFIGANSVSTTVSALGSSASNKGTNLVAHGTSTLAQVIDPANQSDNGTLTGSEYSVIKQGSSFVRSTLTKIAQFVVQTYQGFTQTGTGAVARALLTKALDFAPTIQDFNGATGASDNSAPLTSVINTTRTVALTEGTWQVASGFVSATQPIRLRGASTYGTTLKQTSAAVPTVLSTTGTTGSQIKDLSLDVTANGASANGFPLNYTDVNDSLVENVSITGLTGQGSGFFASTLNNPYINNVRFHNLTVKGNLANASNTNGALMVGAQYSMMRGIYADSIHDFAIEYKNACQYSLVSDAIVSNSAAAFEVASIAAANQTSCAFSNLIAKDCSYVIGMGKATYNAFNNAVCSIQNPFTGGVNKGIITIAGANYNAFRGFLFTGQFALPVQHGGLSNYTAGEFHTTGPIVQLDSGAQGNVTAINHPGARTSIYSGTITNNSGQSVSGATANPVYCHATGEYVGSLSGGWRWVQALSGTTIQSANHKWVYESTGNSYADILTDGTAAAGYAVSKSGETHALQYNWGSANWTLDAGAAPTTYQWSASGYQPATDNSANLGGAVNRWANIYGVTATLGGNVTLNGASPIISFNPPSGTTCGTLNFDINAALYWQMQATTSSIAIARYNAGSFVDSPLIINSSTGVVTVTNLSVGTAGKGLSVKEGSNAKQGTATLVAGSAVVSNTSVTANSRIFLTSQADGGTPGWLRVSTRTAGTSFTITSSSASDTSTVAYEIFEPA